MGYRIRQIEAGTKFNELMGIDTLTRVIPMEIIQATLRECGAEGQRERRLPGWLTVLFCIGMNLLSELSMTGVMEQLMRGTRLIHPSGEEEAPSTGKYSQARSRLGTKVMERLFKRVCRPLATADTAGAFSYGLRLVALDGSVDDVPDSAANSAYFGRASTMLVMWDRGFHDYDMLAGVRSRGGHVLSRLPAHVKPEPVEVLPDGTWLAYVHPSDPKRRANERLLVRVIDYTIDDPKRPGHAQHHRLITTLLDPTRFPARDLIVLYHERWKVEITLDEVKVHQRLLPRPLRSLKPVGVIQELYALLLAHFVVRCIMHQAGLAHDLDPDRLSFVQSLRLIRAASPEFQLVHPAHHDRLWQRLLRDIARQPLPPRGYRTNPRVVKRKMSNFKLKRPEHRALPQPTQPFSQVVVVLSMLRPVLI